MLILIIQIIISIILIALILIQERSTGLGGLLGGETSGFYQVRRGFEKIIFVCTIVLAVGFAILSVIQLVY